MGRDQRGATIVEAAFVLPILFMFLLAILEFGRAYNEYQVLTNAAREAARYAVAPLQGTNMLPLNVALVAEQFTNSAGVLLSQPPSITQHTACQVPLSINGVQQMCTQVILTSSFNFLVPQLLFNKGALSVPISSTVYMREETN